MGIAGCSAFGSHIGLVASASIGDDQRIKVHRLVAAVDCGRVVNSGLVAQQIEAGLIWALAQATVAAPEWVAGMPRARPIGGIGLAAPGRHPANRRRDHPEQRRAGRHQRARHDRRSRPPSPTRSMPATGKRMRSLPFDPMAAA